MGDFDFSFLLDALPATRSSYRIGKRKRQQEDDALTYNRAQDDLQRRDRLALAAEDDRRQRLAYEDNKRVNDARLSAMTEEQRRAAEDEARLDAPLDPDRLDYMRRILRNPQGQYTVRQWREYGLRFDPEQMPYQPTPTPTVPGSTPSVPLSPLQSPEPALSNPTLARPTPGMDALPQNRPPLNATPVMPMMAKQSPTNIPSREATLLAREYPTATPAMQQQISANLNGRQGLDYAERGKLYADVKSTGAPMPNLAYTPMPSLAETPTPEKTTPPASADTMRLQAILDAPEPTWESVKAQIDQMPWNSQGEYQQALERAWQDFPRILESDRKRKADAQKAIDAAKLGPTTPISYQDPQTGAWYTIQVAQNDKRLAPLLAAAGNASLTDEKGKKLGAETTNIEARTLRTLGLIDIDKEKMDLAVAAQKSKDANNQAMIKLGYSRIQSAIRNGGAAGASKELVNQARSVGMLRGAVTAIGQEINNILYATYDANGRRLTNVTPAQEQQAKLKVERLTEAKNNAMGAFLGGVDQGQQQVGGQPLNLSLTITEGSGTATTKKDPGTGGPKKTTTAAANPAAPPIQGPKTIAGIQRSATEGKRLGKSAAWVTNRLKATILPNHNWQSIHNIVVGIYNQ